MLPETGRIRAHRGALGERTQKRLIDAGLELFARYSFDGVSTRILADRAKVNLASIQYYFGSKEGLYHAVARHIVEQVGTWLHPALSQIEQTLERGSPTKEECYSLFCELLGEVITKTLGSPDHKKWLGITMREQLEPTAAFDILYDGFMKPIHRCLRGLVARMLDIRPEDEETKLRVYSMMGQVVIFHVARAQVGHDLNWPAYGPEEVEAVRSIVLEHVAAILRMPDTSSSRPSQHDLVR